MSDDNAPEEEYQSYNPEVNDDAFYENFNYLNPAGIEVGPEAYEYPPFQVGGSDDYVMEYDGDAAAQEATAGLTGALVPGTRGKRRAEVGRGFKCFYCMEDSDRDPFYIPDVTPAAAAGGGTAEEKVIDRAFCIPECAMGWIVHEVSVGNNVQLKDDLVAAIMRKAGRYVKCPLSPFELLCRDMGGLKLRAEAVIDAEDQAPDNLAFWNGMRGDDDEAAILGGQRREERRLKGKALLSGASSGDEEDGDDVV